MLQRLEEIAFSILSGWPSLICGLIRGKGLNKIIITIAVVTTLATSSLSLHFYSQLHPGWWRAASDDLLKFAATPSNLPVKIADNEEMRRRQADAIRQARAASNVWLTGKTTGGRWASKKFPSVQCGATMDGRYYQTTKNGTPKRIAESDPSISSESFGKGWQDNGCADAAPLLDPNSPIWHPFPDNIDAEELAKATLFLMKDSLNDYPSARFRNAFIHYLKIDGTKHFAMCGQLNAKNRFGGYVGWKEFVSVSRDNEWQLGIGDNIGGAALIAAHCMMGEEHWISDDKDYSKFLSARGRIATTTRQDR